MCGRGAIGHAKSVRRVAQTVNGQVAAQAAQLLRWALQLAVQGRDLHERGGAVPAMAGSGCSKMRASAALATLRTNVPW